MKGFVPREKMSKKQKKELDRTQREAWSFSPITRRVESKKVYSRKRKSDVREEMRTPGFSFCPRCDGVPGLMIGDLVNARSGNSDSLVRFGVFCRSRIA